MSCLNTTPRPEFCHFPSHQVSVRAHTVVVAAGALGSPLLMLRSGLNLPAIGRNLYLHPVTGVGGDYETPVYTWKGAPQTIMSDEFACLSGPYGIRLEVVPGHPGIVALATPWYGARDHRRLMQRSSHQGLIVVLVRDHSGGRVRLGAGGRSVITYRLGTQERAHMQRGIAEAARIHLAAGAHDVLTLHSRRHGLPPAAMRSPTDVDAFCRKIGNEAVDRNWSPLFSAHQMGTCRMGSSKREAVCGPDGGSTACEGFTWRTPVLSPPPPV